MVILQGRVVAPAALKPQAAEGFAPRGEWRIKYRSSAKRAAASTGLKYFFAATPVAAMCSSCRRHVLPAQSLSNRCAIARALPWRGHNRARMSAAHDRHPASGVAIGFESR